MSSDSTSASSWDAVAAELRAYRQQQKQTWGDLDHALLGRYLAGEVSAEERSHVEAELEAHPELRMLTEVVSGVLTEAESVQASTEKPRILTFPTSKGRRARFRQLGSLAAAAGLLLGLGLALHQGGYSSLNPDDSLPSSSGDLVAQVNKTEQAFFLPAQPEMVALASEMVEKGEVDKAATVLFAPPAAPAPLAPSPAPPTANFYIHTVARMAGKVLDGKADKAKIVPIAADRDEHQRRNWILQNSVPPLMAGLTQKDDPKLQRDCCDTLKRMGPVARAAARNLEELSLNGCKEVQGVAQQALKSVSQPDWVGVRDVGHVLSAQARQRINARIAELSHKYQVSIVAEAVRTLPEMDRKKGQRYHDRRQRDHAVNDMVRRRSREVGAEQAVFLFICMDPPAVKIAAGPTIQRKASSFAKDFSGTRGEGVSRFPSASDLASELSAVASEAAGVHSTAPTLIGN